MTDQLELFTIPLTPYRTKIIHDPYWDEITEEPENTVLTGKNNEHEDTVSTDFPVSTRHRGDGTGRIQWRTITRKSGKQYKQAWYDWQVYSKGTGKVVYRSRYIPNRLLSQIQALESEKVPVSKILQLLGVNKDE
ncbi:hypothetical protein [Brunnivagina elsteri]|uniref:Uncharacterized protein n=1 Tax=Brunnivagina elsteri CCALA 953 TaxID=987040 RepID=A0A2A2THI3_9CYAN|nr:hypothetical protein [Calothrix elsteri]PAX52859.1 hypothetical protein CK510_17020 [Calothrix elsteri CCALA 953]